VTHRIGGRWTGSARAVYVRKHNHARVAEGWVPTWLERQMSAVRPFQSCPSRTIPSERSLGLGPLMSRDQHPRAPDGRYQLTKAFSSDDDGRGAAGVLEDRRPARAISGWRPHQADRSARLDSGHTACSAAVAEPGAFPQFRRSTP
jgi:hypothetical protein